ncbi:hypothetical protein ZWY2020_058772 [Hordeum vulgare]|nr:hypothetical protein ZWY2020_058772 [Hordeum vulgare]
MVMAQAEPEETPRSQQRPSAGGGPVAGEPSQPAPATPRRLTVWCKSLVFGGDGYAVFDDADGRMVFRVDNYGVGPGSMALMDHAGRVLLTVRRRQRKMLSLMPETWEVYNGDVDDDGHGERCLMIRATKDVCSSSCTASVLAVDEPERYLMRWSRREEWSRIYRRSSTGNETLIAEVRRKRGGPEKATLLARTCCRSLCSQGWTLPSPCPCS